MSLMEPETSIKIGPYRYKIIRSRKKLEKHAFDRGNLFGVTIHDDQAIYIDNKVADDIRKDTELHEVLHCLFFAAGISMPVEREEHIVRCLATTLLNAMRENKAFFLTLMED